MQANFSLRTSGRRVVLNERKKLERRKGEAQFIFYFHYPSSTSPSSLLGKVLTKFGLQKSNFQNSLALFYLSSVSIYNQNAILFSLSNGSTRFLKKPPERQFFSCQTRVSCIRFNQTTKLRWPTRDMLQIKKLLQIKQSCCKIKNFPANKTKLLQIQ